MLDFDINICGVSQEMPLSYEYFKSKKKDYLTYVRLHFKMLKIRQDKK